MNSKVIGAAVAVLVAATGLTACGGGSGKTAPSSPTHSPGAARSGGAGFGALLSNPQAKACLTAAGIALPTNIPTNRPTGTFARRSGFPTGQRPSGVPTGARGSGFPGRFGGGAGANSAELDKIRAALTACGITLPTAGARPSGARPSATPTVTG